MKKVKIGHRKLFLSRGCGISSGEEFKHTFQIADFKSDLYLGKNPNPNLTIVTQSKAVIPFDPR